MLLESFMVPEEKKEGNFILYVLTVPILDSPPPKTFLLCVALTLGSTVISGCGVTSVPASSKT